MDQKSCSIVPPDQDGIVGRNVYRAWLKYWSSLVLQREKTMDYTERLPSKVLEMMCHTQLLDKVDTWVVDLSEDQIQIAIAGALKRMNSSQLHASSPAISIVRNVIALILGEDALNALEGLFNSIRHVYNLNIERMSLNVNKQEYFDQVKHAYQSIFEDMRREAAAAASEDVTYRLSLGNSSSVCLAEPRKEYVLMMLHPPTSTLPQLMPRLSVCDYMWLLMHVIEFYQTQYDEYCDKQDPHVKVAQALCYPYVEYCQARLQGFMRKDIEERNKAAAGTSKTNKAVSLV